MPQATETAPFFIVGHGRSGTTLVRTMLAAHSRLAVPPETHYLKWTDKFGAEHTEAPEDFDAFWAQLCSQLRFRDLDIAPERVLALAEDHGGRTFRGVFAAMLAAYAEKEGKPRVGEKTPGHYLYLDRIFRWWPDARIVVVRRDPRATIASHLGAPWVTQQLDQRDPGSPVMPRLRLFHVAHHAKLWKVAYGQHLAPRGDARFHYVSYEDLVAEPAARIAEIAEFLGESFEPDMVERREAVSGAAQDRNSQAWRDWAQEHEKKSKAAISTEGLTKWRSKLGPRETAVIEAICGRTMERFGYVPDRGPAERVLPAALGIATLRASGVERRSRSGLDRLRSAFGTAEPRH